MDIYLDDIIVYSSTLEDHVKHVKLVLDVLGWEKLYLIKFALRTTGAENTGLSDRQPRDTDGLGQSGFSRKLESTY